MIRRRERSPRHARNTVVIGFVIVVTSLVALGISYNASTGLPGLPSYDISAEVPDAAELTRGVSEVRIGGAPVGIVKDIDAIPATARRPAYARLELRLDAELADLPVDSVVQVRPRSILGAKYLDLAPGESGQTVPEGGTLPIRFAQPAIEFDEVFAVFDRETRRSLRRALGVLGDGLAGRGAALNDAFGATARLMPGLQRVLTTLADPDTNLDGFLRGAAATTGALAEVAPQLGSMVDGGAGTLAALRAAAPQLGETVDAFPATAAVATRTLRNARPLLSDTAALMREAGPAAELLPEAARRLARATGPGARVLRALAAPFAPPGGGDRTTLVALAGRTGLALRRLALDRATSPAIAGLIATVRALRPTLDLFLPAQLSCNVGGTFVRNFSRIMAGGDTSGSWLNAVLVLDPDLLGINERSGIRDSNLLLQSGTQARDLHSNPYPVMDETECEAGNEWYGRGRRIGNVEGKQARHTVDTAPPDGVRDLARAAGLLPAGGGR